MSPGQFHGVHHHDFRRDPPPPECSGGGANACQHELLLALWLCVVGLSGVIVAIKYVHMTFDIFLLAMMKDRTQYIIWVWVHQNQ